MSAILIAEDDDAVRGFLEMALKRSGYRADAVSSGEMALKALKSSDYDLLLTDIIMPGINGIELAQKAKTHSPSLNIVYISGYGTMALAERLQILPEEAILSKPFQLGDLVKSVKTALNI